MDPLAVLNAELFSNDIEVVLASLRRLEAVALSLGAARTKSDLLPALASFAGLAEVLKKAAAGGDAAAEAAAEKADAPMDRIISDEALSVLGENMGKLAALDITGLSVMLIAMEEALCGQDETCVREAAVRGIVILVEAASQSVLTENVLPCIQRLAAHTWFSSRCSACQLLTPLYTHVNSDQAKSSLRSLMVSMCKDEVPIVRKTAFAALPAMCAAVGATFLRSDLFQSLRALCEDEQDTVRVFIIDAALEIAKSVDELNCKEIAIPLVEEGAADMSWRVRRQLARSFHEIAVACGKDVTATSLLPLLAGLLKDTEAEVRTAMIKEIVKVALTIGKDGIVEHVAPVLRSLASDPAESVRVSLSDVIVPLTAYLDESSTQKEVLPIVLEMLQDELPKVRMQVLENLQDIGKVIGMSKLIDSIQPVMDAMANDQRWRIRAGVLGKIAAFTKDAGHSVYESKYHEILFRGLSDTVYEVRKICAQQVADIIKNFGADWAQKSVMPETLKIFDDSTNYLHRMVPLHIIATSAAQFPPTYVSNTLLPVLLTGTKDHIANVRICAIRCLEEILPVAEDSVRRDKIRPALSKMKDDSDRDVQFFSQQVASLIK